MTWFSLLCTTISIDFNIQISCLHVKESESEILERSKILPPTPQPWLEGPNWSTWTCRVPEKVYFISVQFGRNPGTTIISLFGLSQHFLQLRKLSPAAYGVQAWFGARFMPLCTPAITDLAIFMCSQSYIAIRFHLLSTKCNSNSLKRCLQRI